MKSATVHSCYTYVYIHSNTVVPQTVPLHFLASIMFLFLICSKKNFLILNSNGFFLLNFHNIYAIPWKEPNGSFFDLSLFFRGCYINNDLFLSSPRMDFFVFMIPFFNLHVNTIIIQKMDFCFRFRFFFFWYVIGFFSHSVDWQKQEKNRSFFSMRVQVTSKLGNVLFRISL